jgi:hypothetical protein
MVLLDTLHFEEDGSKAVGAAGNKGPGGFCAWKLSPCTGHIHVLADVRPGPGAESFRRRPGLVKFEFLSLLKHRTDPNALNRFFGFVGPDEILIDCAFKHGDFAGMHRFLSSKSTERSEWLYPKVAFLANTPFANQ